MTADPTPIYLAWTAVALVALLVIRRVHHRRRSAPSHSLEYQAYIHSAYWRHYRQQRLAACGHRCEWHHGPLHLLRCHARAVDGHHWDYHHFHNETRESVQMLCRPHHHRADQLRRHGRHGHR